MERNEKTDAAGRGKGKRRNVWNDRRKKSVGELGASVDSRGRKGVSSIQGLEKERSQGKIFRPTGANQGRLTKNREKREESGGNRRIKRKRKMQLSGM